MRATGIVRRVDSLGRIVIPKEIRRMLHMKEDDPIEIFVEKDGVIFKRYNFIETTADAVEELKNQVSENHDLKSRSEVLQKISEIEALLKTEKDDFEGK